jgi:hypothetical protein
MPGEGVSRDQVGEDGKKGKRHSGAHAVVAVSRGGEGTQGEGGLALAFLVR